MGIFQKLYNWIKALDIPAWMKPIVQILNDAMINILKKTGKAYVDFITQKIIEAAAMNISSEAKFKYVFNAARNSTIPFLKQLKDSELNYLIEALVSVLKSQAKA